MVVLRTRISPRSEIGSWNVPSSDTEGLVSLQEPCIGIMMELVLSAQDSESLRDLSSTYEPSHAKGTIVHEFPKLEFTGLRSRIQLTGKRFERNPGS